MNAIAWLKYASKHKKFGLLLIQHPDTSLASGTADVEQRWTNRIEIRDDTIDKGFLFNPSISIFRLVTGSVFTVFVQVHLS